MGSGFCLSPARGDYDCTWSGKWWNGGNICYLHRDCIFSNHVIEDYWRISGLSFCPRIRAWVISIRAIARSEILRRVSTPGELMLEAFTRPWIEWAIRTKNQLFKTWEFSSLFCHNRHQWWSNYWKKQILWDAIKVISPVFYHRSKLRLWLECWTTGKMIEHSKTRIGHPS